MKKTFKLLLIVSLLIFLLIVNYEELYVLISLIVILKLIEKDLEIVSRFLKYFLIFIAIWSYINMIVALLSWGEVILAFVGIGLVFINYNILLSALLILMLFESFKNCNTYIKNGRKQTIYSYIYLIIISIILYSTINIGFTVLMIILMLVILNKKKEFIPMKVYYFELVGRFLLLLIGMFFYPEMKIIIILFIIFESYNSFKIEEYDKGDYNDNIYDLVLIFMSISFLLSYYVGIGANYGIL